MKSLFTIAVSAALAIASPFVAASDMESRLNAALAKTNPGVTVAHIGESQADGIKEIRLSNGEYLYRSGESGYLFSGRLIHFSGTALKDMTEERQRQGRAEALQNLDISETITFEATTDEIGEVFVFTDVTCAYCKNFHKQIADVNQAGVTVHYLALPRDGVMSRVGEIMSRIWCSEDRQAALTEVKADQPLTQMLIPCRAPIQEQFDMAQALGVRGTPSIYDVSGNNLGGYLSAAQLHDLLSR